MGSPHLYALLVGIDAYPAPVPTLRGCVGDVTAMETMLRARVGEPVVSAVVLTDAQATRAAVTDGFRTHLGQATADDVAVFYYSGHGSQQACPPELWGGEPDHLNETIVCVDSRLPGSWDLADKELASLVAGVAASGCHLLVVLDCCHSGTGTRDLDETSRVAPEDERPRPVSTFLEGSTVGTFGATRSLSADSDAAAGRHVLLAACRADELAKEITVLGVHRGALSAALEATLRDGEGSITYREMLRAVTAGVLRRAGQQHPQLESADATELDRPFLGGAIPATPRQLTLSRLPDGWSIDYGAVHGVPEPIGDDSTELAVYPLTAKTSGAPLATATVTSVLPDRSLVTLSAPLDEGSIYRAVVTGIPLKPLQVAVRGVDADTALLREAARAVDSTLLTLVADAPDADLTVEAIEEGFVITRPGVTRPLVPVVAGDGRAERTVAALEHVARWLRLAAVRNPVTHLTTGAVALSLTSPSGHLADDGTLSISYADGVAPPFNVTLQNTTETPLWAALIDLTETYGIFTDAVPSGSVALEAGQSMTIALTGQVSDALWNAGTVTLTDQLKLVTSTIEFDPRSLEQDELELTLTPAAECPVTTRSMGQPATGGWSLPWAAGAEIVGRVEPVTRRLGPQVSPTTGADWRTDDAFVHTTRPRA
ncbi:peptidase C14 caspase catalytic subunit p20 [Humibacillus sp. DSM 29435]|uniref:caspase family protein n=1 Tax=Humibacillus sp. DSM 29435 TaxID=1869167 RepID=UPI0008722E60|nr:caspase family protein [Humibacillus sp. DSM 29435]OFE16396.1 peptidase C14 caspase catalytic subunit p20 [Humibacillus sp. DSM 29435]